MATDDEYDGERYSTDVTSNNRTALSVSGFVPASAAIPDHHDGHPARGTVPPGLRAASLHKETCQFDGEALFCQLLVDIDVNSHQQPQCLATWLLDLGGIHHIPIKAPDKWPTGVRL